MTEKKDNPPSHYKMGEYFKTSDGGEAFATYDPRGPDHDEPVPDQPLPPPDSKPDPAQLAKYNCPVCGKGKSPERELCTDCAPVTICFNSINHGCKNPTRLGHLLCDQCEQSDREHLLQCPRCGSFTRRHGERLCSGCQLYKIANPGWFSRMFGR